MRQRFIKITTIFLFCLSTLVVLGQNMNDIRPQIWSNLYVGWNASDRFALRGGVAYNVLISDEVPWNEITATVSGVFKFHKFMEASAGLYVAAAQQSEKLRSYEYRPYAGFRIFTNETKRWYVTNLTRFEVRAFRYSDKTTDLTFRLRNRTYAVLSLLKPSMVDDKNLFAYGYLEAFYSFEQQARERFFYLFKYKIGLGYRLSYNWRFNLGFIYQDSDDNIVVPSQLPVVINTNWIFEWGVLYVFPDGTK